MNTRGYIAISAIIFLLAAIAHAVRLYNGWVLQIGPYPIAPQFSWLGLVIAAILCLWGFASLRR